VKSQQGAEWEDNFGVGKAIIHQFAGSERQGSFVMIYLPRPGSVTGEGLLWHSIRAAIPWPGRGVTESFSAWRLLMTG